MEENKPYKVYKVASGEVAFTKEFDAIVDCFKTLKQWRDEEKAKQRETKEPELSHPAETPDPLGRP